MKYKINKKPQLIKNGIAYQNKIAAIGLTVREWNNTINVLSEQGNTNTGYLEQLHRTLIGDYNANTEGFVEIMNLPDTTLLLEQHDVTIKELDKDISDLIELTNNHVSELIRLTELIDSHTVDIRLLQDVTNNLLVDVTYRPSNGHLIFERQDGQSFTIDLPLKLIIDHGYYDEETYELVLVLANQDEIRIPIRDILDGIATEEYVDEQITNRNSIVRLDTTAPLKELELVPFMQELANGIYSIVTAKYGYEFLFISDMWLVVPGQEQDEEPELELRKEYARYTADGSSFRYDAATQDWVLSAGGGGGSNGGSVLYVGDKQPPNGKYQIWIDTSGVEISETQTITNQAVLMANDDITVDLTQNNQTSSDEIIDLTLNKNK